MTPLARLLDETAAASKAGPALVIFDLDDTLFSTADRHLRILREFALAIEAGNAEAAGLIRAIQREKLMYSPVDTAKAHGLADELAKDLRDFWFARFFKNPYLLEDSVVPGGPEYAAKVVERGGIPVYMTGRDETMREGTEASLLRHGFPEPDGKRARLILKPKFDTPDFAFKTEMLDQMGHQGAVVGSFENEPAHANLFLDKFPKGRHFLLETKHSGKPVELHGSVHRIKDFRL